MQLIQQVAISNLYLIVLLKFFEQCLAQFKNRANRIALFIIVMDSALNLKEKHVIAGTIEVFKVANVKIDKFIFTYLLNMNAWYIQMPPYTYTDEYTLFSPLPIHVRKLLPVGVYSS